jgi:hypothetical protein
MEETDLKLEGFWAHTPEEENPFPFPVIYKGVWNDKSTFLKFLSQVEAKAMKRTCKGFSRCRLCGIPNGSITFNYNGWKWPNGFKHYIREHNVLPNAEFVEMIYSKGGKYV